jgi:hypothetical protein
MVAVVTVLSILVSTMLVVNGALFACMVMRDLRVWRARLRALDQGDDS